MKNRNDNNNQQKLFNDILWNIQQLMLDKELFEQAKKDLNKICELDDGKSFELDPHSSDPKYPVDLRICLAKDSDKSKLIYQRLLSLSQMGDKGIKFEAKPSEKGDEITFIVKSIQPFSLSNYLNLKNNPPSVANKEILNQAIQLFKKYFPNEYAIHDLEICDGANSMTRPFPHIRSRAFWSPSQLNQDVFGLKNEALQQGSILMRLQDEGLIDYDAKPKPKKISPYRGNNLYSPKNERDQIIINLQTTDLKKLEDTLVRLIAEKVTENKIAFKS